MRAPAAPPRRSSRTTTSPRSRRSAEPSAPASTRASSRSPAPSARRRRRTSSRRSARPPPRVVAAEDGFNNEIGLPLTLCRVEADTEVVVTEMGMRGAGQIARSARDRAAARRPDHLDRAGAPRAARKHREHRAREGRAARALRRRSASCPPTSRSLASYGASHASSRPTVESRDGARTRVVERRRVLDFAARHQAQNAAARARRPRRARLRAPAGRRPGRRSPAGARRRRSCPAAAS